MSVPANIYYGRTRVGVEVGSARGLGLLVRNPEISDRIMIVQTNEVRRVRGVMLCLTCLARLETVALLCLR